MKTRNKQGRQSNEKPFRDRDFTGGGIYALPRFRGTTGDEEIDQRVHELVEDWNCGDKSDLIEELIVTSLGIGHDEIGPAELKLMNRSLKEMREANRLFEPYGDHRKVVVYGSARTEPDRPEAIAAEEFSKRMLSHGFMTITGAGDGIMGAAQRGAGRMNSFGLNIRLPFEQSANETILGDEKLITFNYFFTRKLTFAKESDAVALFPGGFGTMDECFEALTLMQTGKATIYPIVMIDAPGGTYWKTFVTFLKEHLLRQELISPEDIDFIKATDDLDEAVEEIVRFYRVFHSYRYVDDKMVIRLNQRISDLELEQINEDFQDLAASGRITQAIALAEESNETAIIDLPRLVFSPDRRRYGRLRRLIDRINSSETIEN
ncbi:MAG: TIGR00730 family Rossman fold protein [Verrucomicrobiota bacterium]